MKQLPPGGVDPPAFNLVSVICLYMPVYRNRLREGTLTKNAVSARLHKI